MKKYFFLSVLAIAMGVAMTSCTHSDDPSYDDVTPPTVNLASPCVSGIITDKAGNPIQGATVTVGTYTATTDENGAFVITDVQPGTYDVTVEAEGMTTIKGVVVVEASTTSTLTSQFSVTMPSEDNVIDLEVTAAEGGEEDLVTEALEGNHLAEIPVELEVPAEAVNEDGEIIVVPLYDESEATEETSKSRVTRAESTHMLIGAKVSPKNPSMTIIKPLKLRLTLSEELTTAIVVKHLVGDEWIDMPFSTFGSTIEIKITEFGYYGIFLPYTVTNTRTNDPLWFEQSTWDNLYGSAPMQVESAKFSFNVGSRIVTKGTSVLTALLIERMAYKLGASWAEVEANYPLNVTLPIGTRLDIKGVQQNRNITFSALGSSVTGTNYGTVSVSVRTSNRQHTGSGN